MFYWAESLTPHFLSCAVGFLWLPVSNPVVYWLVICNWVIKWGQVQSTKLVHFQKPDFQFSGASGKATNPLRRCKRGRFNPWIGKTPWSRTWQPTPVLWPGKFHGQRSLGDPQPMGSQRVRHDWACIHSVPHKLPQCGLLEILEESNKNNKGREVHWTLNIRAVIPLLKVPTQKW